jgi:hypothetical protein
MLFLPSSLLGEARPLRALDIDDDLFATCSADCFLPFFASDINCLVSSETDLPDI